MSMDDDFIGVDSAEEEIDTTEQPTANNRAEWFKFAVFVVVLIVVMGTVWLASPLIFNNIVPAVMGKNLPAEVTDDTTRGGTQTEEEGIEEVTSEESESDEASQASDSTGDESDNTADATTDDGNEAETDTTEETADADAATGESQFQTVYTIRQGDTLAAIARLYGVPMQAIMDANGLTNASLIVIGDELKIPNP